MRSHDRASLPAWFHAPVSANSLKPGMQPQPLILKHKQSTAAKIKGPGLGMGGAFMEALAHELGTSPPPTDVVGPAAAFREGKSQSGHTARLSAKRDSIDRFPGVYFGAKRDDIRHSHGNLAEKVGSQRLPVQGTNCRAGCELRSRLGEQTLYPDR